MAVMKPRLFLTSVGTSSLRKLTSLYNISMDDLVDSVLKGTHKSMPFWASLENIPTEAITSISAELNTIDQIYREKLGSSLKGSNDEFVFMSTDTGDGYAAGVLLKEILVSFFGVSSDKIHIERIPRLTVSSLSDFRVGISNLWRFIYRTYLEKKNHEKILVGTGGFKAVVPYLTVYASVLGMPSYYIFEGKDSGLIEFPPMHVTMNFPSSKEFMDLLEEINEKGAVPRSQYESKLLKFLSPEQYISMVEIFRKGNEVYISLSLYAKMWLDMVNG